MQNNIQVNEIKTDKKRYLPLLLLADEQENMIDTYLARGTLLVLTDDDIKAVCVVTDEGDGILEIKNLAVNPAYQRQGYGRQMVEYILKTYRKKYATLQVGTGDTPSTLSFYAKCGFKKSHLKRNFFLDNYDHIIIEDGKQLIDMVYLQQKFK